eukprot:2462966-Alexandrium_andersonii.AAC.1
MFLDVPRCSSMFLDGPRACVDSVPRFQLSTPWQLLVATADRNAKLCATSVVAVPPRPLFNRIGRIHTGKQCLQQKLHPCVILAASLLILVRC